jgi:hypothetical protein
MRRGRADRYREELGIGRNKFRVVTDGCSVGR